MSNSKVIVPVGQNLYHDWESRGLLHNLDININRQARRVWIEATCSVIQGLIDDAQLQIEPCMEPAPSFRRTCQQFIERATGIINQA